MRDARSMLNFTESTGILHTIRVIQRLGFDGVCSHPCPPSSLSEVTDPSGSPLVARVCELSASHGGLYFANRTKSRHVPRDVTKMCFCVLLASAMSALVGVDTGLLATLRFDASFCVAHVKSESFTREMFSAPPDIVALLPRNVQTSAPPACTTELTDMHV